MTTVPSTPPSTSLIPKYMGEPMRPAPRRLHVVTAPATAELLIPTKPPLPPLPRRLSPRRQPRIGVAWAIAWSALAAGELAYAIFQTLVGAR